MNPTKRSTGLRQRSITSQIFSAILSMIDDYFFIFSQPSAVLYVGGDVDAARLMLQRKAQKLRRLSRRQYNQAFLRLKKQRLLELQQEGEKIFIALTQRGFEEALKRRIISKKNRLKKPFRCYVSFDIPESVKPIRAALRHLLKEAGFKMTQLSLWSTDRDVGGEMATFVKLIDAEKWVHVFLATPITNTNKQKKSVFEKVSYKVRSHLI